MGPDPNPNPNPNPNANPYLYPNPNQVAYPADENSIEALQQLCGNLFSALLVPIAEGASKGRLPVPGGLGELRGDFVLLTGLTAGGLAFFSTFDSTLRRSALECAVDGDGDSCVMVGELTDDEVRTPPLHRTTSRRRPHPPPPRPRPGLGASPAPPPHRLRTASAPPLHRLRTATAPPFAGD